MGKYPNQKVWMHNSFLGCVAMAKKNMQRIMDSTTATTNSKNQAANAWYHLNLLSESLRTRVDQENPK